MNMVPFTIEDLYGGLGECHGLLRDEGENLCFEFRTQDSLAGLIRSRVREVRIPVKELVSVQLTKGWLGTTWLGVTIVIQAAKLDTLKEVPRSSQGRVELSIARKDADAAEKFVASLHEEDGKSDGEGRS
jgi:hypothetical protein